MIQTNNTPVEANINNNNSSQLSKDIIAALGDNSNSVDHGTCLVCRRKAIGPHGYCANHI